MLVSHKPTRRSVHPRGYDYSQPGALLGPICVKDQRCISGMVKENNLILSEIGEIVEACWKRLPVHFQHIYLDEFVLMPNHLHGIIFLVTKIERKAFANDVNTIGLNPRVNASPLPKKTPRQHFRVCPATPPQVYDGREHGLCTVLRVRGGNGNMRQGFRRLGYEWRNTNVTEENPIALADCFGFPTQHSEINAGNAPTVPCSPRVDITP